jgi:tRNA/rRNA methyltransferase
LQHPLRRLGETETARLVHKQLLRGRVALLFGSEKRGLSNEDFSHCHWLLRIPTSQEHGSMNLGQAVAVCLYEIARRAKPGLETGRTKAVVAAKREETRPANAGELERITTLLIEALRASGYLAAKPSAAAGEKIRRMVRRLSLTSSDAKLWLGILRQMMWKMRRIG